MKEYTIIFEYFSNKKETITLKTSNLDFSIEQYVRNREPFLRYEIIEEIARDEDNQ